MRKEKKQEKRGIDRKEKEKEKEGGKSYITKLFLCSYFTMENSFVCYETE